MNYLVASIPSLAGRGDPLSFLACSMDFSLSMSCSGDTVAGESFDFASSVSAFVSGSLSTSGCGGANPSAPAGPSAISRPWASTNRVLVSYRVENETLPSSALTCASSRRLPSWSRYSIFSSRLRIESAAEACGVTIASLGETCLSTLTST